MDPTELTKHLPEIAKATTAVAASIPFTAIVKKMLGPAADELAEMWRDQVRLYRYERQLKCVEKAEKMAKDAGFSPQAVPPKILFPLLEGASFEEDESLHDMWAALLANAASPENVEKVRPGFIATLKGMAPDEAVLLIWIYEHHERANTPLDVYVDLGEAPFLDVGVSADGLEAAQLIRRGDLNTTARSGAASGKQAPTSRAVTYERRADKSYVLTDRGHVFVTACARPQFKPKS